ncbi:MAG TPA: hypothetical protein EYG51_24075 [Pseudomonadales bacterium]|nr:hypothetical protein [Pseudomonadales bacterium]
MRIGDRQKMTTDWKWRQAADDILKEEDHQKVLDWWSEFGAFMTSQVDEQQSLNERHRQLILDMCQQVSSRVVEASRAVHGRGRVR